MAAEQAKGPLVLTPHYHGVGHTALRRALHRAYRPAGRRLMAASLRIVAVSAAEAALVLRDFPRQVQRDKITVVPLAVADPVRGRQPYPGESNVVLTVARQEPYKRTDLLIRAAVELRTRGVPARLVVVGDGSGIAAYRQLAARLGAEDVVTFTGAVDEQTLGRWWASASLYATASLQEAFGIGLAEALVAGLPVVASGIPAHREVVRRAGSDALALFCSVDAPDVEVAAQYADAMVRLLFSTDSCQERAVRCTLPAPAEMVEQLLETLSAARS
jgi:glycosyltransferase involved in cell wall biosynthesis